MKIRAFTFKVKNGRQTIDEVTFYADTPEEAKKLADTWRKRLYPNSTGLARVKKIK